MNLFTGRIYASGKTVLYSALSEMPALLRAGGILTMSGEKNGNRFDNPQDVEVYIGTGADGSFQLYEDDGITEHADEASLGLYRDWVSRPRPVRILALPAAIPH